MEMPMRIAYNSPFVLTFMFVVIAVMFWNNFTGGLVNQEYFTLYPISDYIDPVWYLDPMWYWRLVSYAIGHDNWDHLIKNGTIILLIGPYLEEKYGGISVFWMCLFTTLVTGLLNTFLFPYPLLGASGIVFMMILLGSFTNVKTGYIPLTFILILLLFLGSEILRVFEDNRISEFSHIVGGICGSIFGFMKNKK